MTEHLHPTGLTSLAGWQPPAPPYPTPLPQRFAQQPFDLLPLAFQGRVLAALAALDEPLASNGAASTASSIPPGGAGPQAGPERPTAAS